MTVVNSTSLITEAREGRPSGSFPVVGETYPFLGGPFGVFETPTVHGLAWVRVIQQRPDDPGIDRCDILMLAAFTRGQGDGGRFVDALMQAYRVVGVWHVGNRQLAGMLRRRRFVPATLDTDPFTTGYLWER